MSDLTVRARNVSRRFYLHHERSHSLQEQFVSLFRGRRAAGVEEFWALRDVSFDIAQGETVGLVGPNGTGKSTLLKIIGRILLPTAGSIRVNGRVSTLLELGAGFHPELTGIENIFLNGSLLGLTRQQISARLQSIIDFSELHQFIDTPIKHYSSGMQVRLGFSIAINVEPDILLVDEALAVGDEHFQEKCKAKFEELRQTNTTLIMVTHAMPQIEALCSRALWIQNGRLAADGAPAGVIEAYLEHSRTSYGEPVGVD